MSHGSHNKLHTETRLIEARRAKANEQKLSRSTSRSPAPAERDPGNVAIRVYARSAVFGGARLTFAVGLLDATLANAIMIRFVHALGGPMNSDADAILYITLFTAVSFVLGRALTLRRVRLDWVIPGEGKFDVKTSWVANTTLFGAILGTPIKDMTPSGAINSLNVLFLALGAVAVLVQLLGAQSNKDRTGQDTYQTPVWSYLLAALVALWAAAGQLLTLAHMIWNAKREVISASSEVVFLASVALATLVLAIYVWKMMRRHLQSAVTPRRLKEQRSRIQHRYRDLEIRFLRESPRGQDHYVGRDPSYTRKQDFSRGTAPVSEIAAERTVL